MYLIYAINYESLEITVYDNCERKKDAISKLKKYALNFMNEENPIVYNELDFATPGFCLCSKNENIYDVFYKTNEITYGLISARYHNRTKKLMTFSIIDLNKVDNKRELKITDLFNADKLLPPLISRFPPRSDSHTMNLFRNVMDELKNNYPEKD